MQGRTEAADLVHHLDRITHGGKAIVSEARLLSVCRACHPLVEGDTRLGEAAKGDRGQNH